MSGTAFFRSDIPFSSFSQAHFVTILLSLALLILLVVVGRRLKRSQNLLIGRLLSLFLALTLVVYIALSIGLGRFDIAVHLPLSTCNLFALLAPWLFWNPNHKYFEIVYFMVMAGTLQSVITPDLYVGFPTYGFFKYWITHVGLVILVIHYLLRFQLYPTAKGIVRTFVWLNIYVLALMPINLLLDANYFYLMAKPINPSILDLFGPWPIYILVVELLAMGFFALAYLPVLVIKKRQFTDRIQLH
ncbi:MAG: TIGR02206 family membrane protein [Porticoccaceae bacterium]|nr:TIGR02206 family membrane protein [Porticoccaceae bacterium]